MGWVEIVVVFLLTWWMVFFTTLPFGARPADEPGKGHEPGAPARPRLGLKVLVATAIAATLTAALAWAVDSGLISLRDIMQP